MLKIIFWISFGLIIYTYFWYPLILWILSIFLSKLNKKMEITPLVSMIISAYNEEKVIESRIKNCLELDYPKDKLEIIIGSDGSTDNTNKIIERYVPQGIKFFKYDVRRGKVNILNDLIPQANGEIVIFSDANTVYKSDAIKKLIHNFEDPHVGCVCGELIFKNDKENEVGNLEEFYWRYEQFLKRIEGMHGVLLGANGGIYAIHKKLFRPLPSDIIIEDFIIPMNILVKGYKVIYEPEAVAYEETSKRIVQEMERRIRIGAGDYQALLLTWRLLNPIRGFVAFAYFSHKVIRWFVPHLLLITFLTNIILVSNSFYLSAFMMQCIFYGIAVWGRFFPRLNIRLKMFRLPYYFVSMNLALFFGFIKFCTNSQSVTWKRTER